MKRFDTFHPAALLLFYICILLLSMLSMDPVLLLASVCGSISFYCAAAYPRLSARSGLFFCVLFLLVTVTNPLFSHNGVTVLFYLNHQPVTKEAICCGAALGAMLLSVLYWCRTLQIFMTSDKLLYLFGRISPSLGLLLSMCLRFTPVFRRQYQNIHQVQKTLGYGGSDQPLDRIRCHVRSFGILVTWSMEHAIETADSMNGRGYGLGQRTAFSLFCWRLRDTLLTVFCLAATGGILACRAYGALHYYYYPAMTPHIWDAPHVICYSLVWLLMLSPVILEGVETLRWNYCRSAI